MTVMQESDWLIDGFVPRLEAFDTLPASYRLLEEKYDRAAQMLIEDDRVNSFATETTPQQSAGAVLAPFAIEHY